MPTIPTYDSLQVAPQQRPGVHYDAPQTGAQNARLGEALQRAGGQVQQMIVAEQDRADMIRVDDALNQTKLAINDATYNKDTGYLTKQGKDAFPADRPLDAVYGEAVSARIQDISATLGNENQRRMYQQHAQGALTDFKAGVQRHSSQQFEKYSVATNNATVDLAVDSAARNWNSPTVVGQELTNAETAINKNAELQGIPLDDPINKELKLRATSAIYSRSVKAALEANDLDTAARYLNMGAVSGKMSADDMLQVRGHIETQQRIQTADRVSQRQIMQAAPAMAPTQAGTAWGAVRLSESGGQQFDSQGKTLIGYSTDKNGVKHEAGIGIAQITKTTAKEMATRLGIPYDENRLRTDAAYNESLGKAYYDEQLVAFAGDVEKATAAYKSGPGAVRAAIVAAANPKSDRGSDWRAYLPDEGRKGTAFVMSKLLTGGGKPSKPSLTDLVQSALADAEVGPNPHPELKKMIIDNVTRMYRIGEESAHQAEKAAVEEAQRWLIDNPGKTPYQMPLGIRDAVKQAAPGQWDNISRFAKAETQTDNTVWLTLHDQIARGQPVDLYKHANDLSREDLQGLAKMQSKPVAEMKDTVALHEQLSVAHNIMKLGAHDMEAKGLFDRSVIDAVQRESKQKGKPLNDAERNVIIENMLKEGRIPGRVFDTKGRAYEFVGKPEQERFVPDADRAKIVAALKRANIPVTDDAVLGMYHRLNP
jgi:soluble lytic murein transglycosylase